MSSNDRAQDAPPGARTVTEADVEAVTELFARAFYEDPVWSWAFADPQTRVAHLRRLWSLFMHSALPYGSVFVTEDGAAASLWIPPGMPELIDEDEARLEPLVRELAGSRADDVLTLLDRFGAHDEVGLMKTNRHGFERDADGYTHLRDVRVHAVAARRRAVRTRSAGSRQLRIRRGPHPPGRRGRTGPQDAPAGNGDQIG